MTLMTVTLMTGPLTKILWRHSHQLFELTVEMGESIETAAIGNLRDGVPAVAEHPACSRQQAVCRLGTYPVKFEGQTGLPCRVIIRVE